MKGVLLVQGDKQQFHGTILTFIDETFPDLADSKKFKIRLLLSEILSNALIHGNKEDPSKYVFVIYEMENNILKFEIKDEGSGFDPEAVKDKIDESCDERGRGVEIINRLCDEIKYEENGSKSISVIDIDKL